MATSDSVPDVKATTANPHQTGPTPGALYRSRGDSWSRPHQAQHHPGGVCQHAGLLVQPQGASAPAAGRAERDLGKGTSDRRSQSRRGTLLRHPLPLVTPVETVDSLAPSKTDARGIGTGEAAEALRLEFREVWWGGVLRRALSGRDYRLGSRPGVGTGYPSAASHCQTSGAAPERQSSGHEPDAQTLVTFARATDPTKEYEQGTEQVNMSTLAGRSAVSSSVLGTLSWCSMCGRRCNGCSSHRWYCCW